MVRSDEDRTIIGFVNKVELRYALGASQNHCIGCTADIGYRQGDAHTASVS